MLAEINIVPAENIKSNLINYPNRMLKIQSSQYTAENLHIIDNSIRIKKRYYTEGKALEDIYLKMQAKYKANINKKSIIDKTTNAKLNLPTDPYHLLKTSAYDHYSPASKILKSPNSEHEIPKTISEFSPSSYNHSSGTTIFLNHKLATDKKNIEPLKIFKKVYNEPQPIKKRRDYSGNLDYLGFKSLLDDSINEEKLKDIDSARLPYNRKRLTNISSINSNESPTKVDKKNNLYPNFDFKIQKNQLKFRRKSCHCKWCGGISTLELKFVHLPSYLAEHNNQSKPRTLELNNGKNSVKNFFRRKKNPDFFTVAKVCTNALLLARKKIHKKNQLKLINAKMSDNLQEADKVISWPEIDNIPKNVVNSLNQDNTDNCQVKIPINPNYVEYPDAEPATASHFYSESLNSLNSRNGSSEHDFNIMLNHLDNTAQSHLVKSTTQNASEVYDTFRATPKIRTKNSTQPENRKYDPLKINKQTKGQDNKLNLFSPLQNRNISNLVSFQPKELNFALKSFDHCQDHEIHSRYNNTRMNTEPSKVGEYFVTEFGIEKTPQNTFQNNRQHLTKIHKTKIKSSLEESHLKPYYDKTLVKLAGTLARFYSPKNLSHYQASTKNYERKVPEHHNSLLTNNINCWFPSTSSEIGYPISNLQENSNSSEALAGAPIYSGILHKTSSIKTISEKENNERSIDVGKSAGRLACKISNHSTEENNIGFKNLHNAFDDLRINDAILAYDPLLKNKLHTTSKNELYQSKSSKIKNFKKILQKSNTNVDTMNKSLERSELHKVNQTKISNSKKNAGYVYMDHSKQFIIKHKTYLNFAKDDLQNQIK